MSSVNESLLAASFGHCHRVARERARNFYYGLKLTPEPKRSAVYAIYAFMRYCDDLADGDEQDLPADLLAGIDVTNVGDDEASQRRVRIEAFRAAMQRVIDAPHDAPLPQGPVWPAFAHVMRTYPIDPAHLHGMLDGQLQDLERFDYANFDELYAYCFRVASTVGLVCVAVWGHDGDASVAKLAEQRGIAFQLTNILRDLAEDAERGRCYLPAEDFERFGYDAQRLGQGVADEAFDRFMAFQIDRARSYYEQSKALESHLDARCRSTCWAMCRIYSGLLERIAADPRRVLRQRVRLSGMQKAGLAAAATWRRTWAG